MFMSARHDLTARSASYITDARLLPGDVALADHSQILQRSDPLPRTAADKRRASQLKLRRRLLIFFHVVACWLVSRIACRMDDKAAGTSTAPHHSTTGQPLPLDDLSQQVEAMSLLAPSTGGEGQQKEEEGAAEAKGGGKSKKKKKVSGSERRRRQREKAEADPRLPPELVYHILDLVVEEVTAIWAGQVGEERRRLLRTACLVCSLWRDEAQKLLWKTVFLTSNAGLRSFSLTDKQPKVLVFNEPESAPRLDGQLVGAVLEKVRGVKRLKVDGIDGFSPAWICNDRFAGQ